MTYICIENKLHTFCLHQIYTALYNFLIELHVWNTVHQKTAGLVFALVNCNAVTAAIKPVCTGKSCRTRTNYGDFFTAANGWNLRLHGSD